MIPIQWPSLELMQAALDKLPSDPELLLVLFACYLIHAMADDADKWLRNHPDWSIAAYCGVLSFVARVTIYLIAAAHGLDWLHATFGGHDS